MQSRQLHPLTAAFPDVVAAVAAAVPFGCGRRVAAPASSVAARPAFEIADYISGQWIRGNRSSVPFPVTFRAHRSSRGQGLEPHSGRLAPRYNDHGQAHLRVQGEIEIHDDEKRRYRRRGCFVTREEAQRSYRTPNAENGHRDRHPRAADGRHEHRDRPTSPAAETAPPAPITEEAAPSGAYLRFAITRKVLQRRRRSGPEASLRPSFYTPPLLEPVACHGGRGPSVTGARVVGDQTAE